ncbi:hemolysin III family protein [Microvirga sp. CF3062]|uniref:PAQR family membrane homeostasis protein TrhA n=1 Tax=Microvirga sp. CF3062 TaxID=3110182 RepID=UPI002E7A512E|nr:hemolysin III family protein [Microvirga sp. CF3062]MEE1655499.1 hemolysin III family protein [Microvirga sp. CF3062]
MRWDYDKQEVIADGIVHAVGVTVGTVSIISLLIMAAPSVGVWEFTSILVYGIGLLTVLTVSALYNLWPVSPIKWMLRRFDHSAIYLLIAGTYTPFITQVKTSTVSLALLIGVWLTSAVGIALKLRFPGRFDRLSIVLYLLLSWSGVMAYESVFGALTTSTLWLLAVGGIIYTAGVVFHLWENLRFQNAIWHGFVLVAAACHYGAVLDSLVLARSW